MGLASQWQNLIILNCIETFSYQISQCNHCIIDYITKSTVKPSQNKKFCQMKNLNWVECLDKIEPRSKSHFNSKTNQAWASCEGGFRSLVFATVWRHLCLMLRCNTFRTRHARRTSLYDLLSIN